MKHYFIDTKPTENQVRLIRDAVVNGYDQDDLWSAATARHGPAGSNVVEGLLRRRFLDYFEGNRGSTLRPTDLGRAFVERLEGAVQ